MINKKCKHKDTGAEGIIKSDEKRIYIMCSELLR